MRKFTFKLWAASMLMSVSSQAMAADDFTDNRTDFRDESIYFMITTRFYDGDPKNNVLCWDNQQCQIATGDPCWRGDFQGIIDKLDSPPSGLPRSFRTHRVTTIMATMRWTSPMWIVAIRAVTGRRVGT